MKPISANDLKRHTFKIDPAIAGSLQGLSEQDWKDVQIHVIHKWYSTRECLLHSPHSGCPDAEGRKISPTIDGS
jgi:hypothetical protein